MGHERPGEVRSGQQRPGGAGRSREGTGGANDIRLGRSCTILRQVASNTRKHKKRSELCQKTKKHNKNTKVPELVITLGFGFGAPDFESTSKVEPFFANTRLRNRPPSVAPSPGGLANRGILPNKATQIVQICQKNKK